MVLPRAQTCMLILWDPVNGPHTTDRTPGTVTLRHPGNHSRSNRVGQPPGCQSTTVPPQAKPSPPAGAGALHRTRVKPSQRLSGGTQPEDGVPPGRHAVEGPRPARRRRQCERETPAARPPHARTLDASTARFSPLQRSGDHTAEAAPGHRPRVHATAEGPPHPTGSPDDEQESLHRKRGGVRSPKTAHPPVDTRCRGPSQKRGGRGPGHK